MSCEQSVLLSTTVSRRDSLLLLEVSLSLLRGEILKTLLKSSLGCADAFSLIFHLSFVKKKFHLFSRLCRNIFSILCVKIYESDSHHYFIRFVICQIWP